MVIDAIIIRIVITHGIFLVNDLINCDASELYCVSKRRESSSSMKLASSSLILFI